MDMEAEIKKIRERNRRVELEKAWETSCTRRVSITLLTYAVMVCIMHALELDAPFVNAVIPTVGFALSNISADFIKSVWLEKYGDKKKGT